MMQQSLQFVNGTSIKWDHGLDGGGSSQFIDILDAIQLQRRIYTSGLEWCAGLGAIGFSILDANLCHKLTFMDLYEPFKECIKNNASMNNLNDRVDTLCCDAIYKIPKECKFDLVVANPPHCLYLDSNSHDDPHLSRLILDDGWKIHREFFSNIKGYLLPKADLFLTETSVHEEHINLAQSHGLAYIKDYPAALLKNDSNPSAVVMHYKYEEKIY